MDGVNLIFWAVALLIVYFFYRQGDKLTDSLCFRSNQNTKSPLNSCIRLPGKIAALICLLGLGYLVYYTWPSLTVITFP